MPIRSPEYQITTMKAIIQEQYGSPDALRLGEIPVPTVGDGEVLVRVKAAAVNPGDLFSTLGRPTVVRLATGLLKPKHPVPGRALAGTVEAVAQDVSRFRPGDEVFGEISGGAYADFVVVAEKVLARKPHNTTFEQAAAVPLSAVTALQGLRKAQVGPGDKVLINGASGGVGTFAVQIARHLEAEVTAVCSTRNADLVRSLGANHVVDYTKEDFTQRGPSYDVVFDLIGNHRLTDLVRVLNRAGTLILSNGPPSPTIRRILKALVMSPFTRRRLKPLLQTVNREDLDHLTELIEAGRVTAIVDRVCPMTETAAALRYQAEGHAQGRTVISMVDDGTPEHRTI